MIGAMPTARPSPSRWLVYLLRCSDGSLYCGITNELPKRLKAHAAGKGSRALGLQRVTVVKIGGPEAGGGDQEAAPVG